MYNSGLQLYADRDDSGRDDLCMGHAKYRQRANRGRSRHRLDNK